MKINLKTIFPKNNSTGKKPPVEFLHNKNLITDFINTPPFFDEPKIFIFNAELNIPKHVAFDKDIRKEVMLGYAGGASLNKDKALWKVIGESAERFSLFLDNSYEKFGSYNNLSNSYNLLDPADIDYTTKKLNLIQNRDKEISWIKGMNLTTNKESLIPKQLVAVPYWDEKDEIIWRAPITTGACAGQSIEDVVYGGICEVTERDSFMTAWLLQKPLKKLSIQDLELNNNATVKFLKESLDYLYKYRLFPEFYLIPKQSKIHTVVCVLNDYSNKAPAFTIGLKSDLNIIYCLIGALEESLQLRPWSRQIYNSNKKEFNNDLITLEERVILWQTEKAKIKFKKWLDKAEYDNLNKYEEQTSSLKCLIEHIKEIDDADVFFKDLTYNLPKSLNEFGIKTGKICIPKYQPLYLMENLADYCLNRLEKVNNDSNLDNLEKFPHPIL